MWVVVAEKVTEETRVMTEVVLRRYETVYQYQRDLMKHDQHHDGQQMVTELKLVEVDGGAA